MVRELGCAPFRVESQSNTADLDDMEWMNRCVHCVVGEPDNVGRGFSVWRRDHFVFFFVAEERTDASANKGFIKEANKAQFPC